MSTDTVMVETRGIMADIPAPPALSLPSIAFSAPVSRVATPPPVKRRSAISQPVSPKAKKPLSPIGGFAKKPLSPIAKSLLSPTRATSKHRYHVTFGSAPRHSKKAAPCPVHAYASAEQEIAHMPTKSVGGVRFGDTPRDLLAPSHATCPVHVYADAKSMLSSMGNASFAKYDERKEEPAGCPVHAYATPTSSLRGRPATFAKSVTPRNPIATGGPPVHAYAEPLSTLSARGATAFSTETPRRDAFQRTDRALAPVHAYAAPTSSLRSLGGTFGSAPTMRGSTSGSLPALSRTGLLVWPSPPATSRASRAEEPPRAPRTLKPLLTKQLVPLSEEAAESPPAAKAPADQDGADSPREVEALELP